MGLVPLCVRVSLQLRLVKRKLFEPWPFLLGRCSSADEDLLKLLLLVLAHEEGHAGHDLSKNAPNGPHVNTSRVVLASQQNVRRTVPKRHNLVSEVLDGDSESTREAEVC